jgi:hypothetical protein
MAKCLRNGEESYRISHLQAEVKLAGNLRSKLKAFVKWQEIVVAFRA